MADSSLDLDRFDALTFDCYGTLIDWERGILDTLAPVVGRDGRAVDGERLIAGYHATEASLQAGEYLPYREIAARALAEVCGECGVIVTETDRERFQQTVGTWPAFEDSAESLQRLAGRYRLGVITNCDDELFALSSQRLGVEFDWIVTAQQAGAYKPSELPFRLAFERIDVPQERILHVAQSLFHDHPTARRLGMHSVWIDRRGDSFDAGGTPSTDLADLAYPDMRSFADAAGC
jgi:2-haloacid dehalogenase